MVPQISLDAYKVDQLAGLLRRASSLVSKTRTPMVLYRQTLEEEDGSYEELVCTLAPGYVIEQRVTSGGIIPPSFHEQHVFEIDEYPRRLASHSRERFADVVEMLESELA